MIGKTCWMLIIYWHLSADGPIEQWRIQQPTKIENCAEMTMLSHVGTVAAMTVKCNSWKIMRPKEGDEK